MKRGKRRHRSYSIGEDKKPISGALAHFLNFTLPKAKGQEVNEKESQSTIARVIKK